MHSEVGSRGHSREGEGPPELKGAGRQGLPSQRQEERALDFSPVALTADGSPPGP